MTLKENIHHLAVLISGHHGPVVFISGDGADVGSVWLASAAMSAVTFTSTTEPTGGGGGVLFQGG
jgi:hypothetical protein